MWYFFGLHVVLNFQKLMLNHFMFLFSTLNFSCVLFRKSDYTICFNVRILIWDLEILIIHTPWIFICLVNLKPKHKHPLSFYKVQCSNFNLACLICGLLIDGIDNFTFSCIDCRVYIKFDRIFYHKQLTTIIDTSWTLSTIIPRK